MSERWKTPVGLGYVLTLVMVAVAAPTPADTPGEVLASRGLRRSGTWYVLPDEADLTKRLAAIKRLETDVREAEDAAEQAGRTAERVEREIDRLTARQSQLSAQLDRLRSNVDRYNATVTEINQITVELDRLMRVRLVDYVERRDELEREKLAARGALVSHIVSMRRVVDGVRARYETLAADSEVVAALEAKGEAAERTFRLGPSSKFAASVKRVERVERKLVTGHVPLRRENESFWVMVALNGKPPIEMVLDTGADLVSIPARVARDIGLVAGPNDQSIRVGLADGSQVDATLTRLATVGVGTFEVADVACIVMPANLDQAPPLLGGAFLNQFSYEIDTAKGQVTLRRLAGEDTRGGRPSTGR